MSRDEVRLVDSDCQTVRSARKGRSKTESVTSITDVEATCICKDSRLLQSMPRGRSQISAVSSKRPISKRVGACKGYLFAMDGELSFARTSARDWSPGRTGAFRTVMVMPEAGPTSCDREIGD